VPDSGLASPAGRLATLFALTSANNSRPMLEWSVQVRSCRKVTRNLRVLAVEKRALASRVFHVERFRLSSRLRFAGVETGHGGRESGFARERVAFECSTWNNAINEEKSSAMRSVPRETSCKCNRILIRSARLGECFGSRHCNC
jgi:hypothetical protein